MPRFKLQTGFFAVCIFGISMGVSAQISPDCSTAIPICSNTPVNGGTQGYGLDDFSGAAESGCLEPTQTGFIESNSAWYRFRTGASGQLGFNISFDPSEDWDFALYRATDCNALGDPVRCNFFDNRDQKSFMGVGEDPTGDTSSLQYEPWLDVQPGEEYLLLINNFSNTNSGFAIQFSGEIFTTNPYDALDCSIISNLLGPPVAACQGDVIPLDATTSGAVSYEWFAETGTGFQLLSAETQPTLNVSTPALYRVRILMPDGSQEISDVQVGFSPNPMAEPVSDVSACGANNTFNLASKDPEVLGSQNASDYRISYHNSLLDAQQGRNPLDQTLNLSPGTQTIYVRMTSVENPDCFDATQSFQLEAVQAPLMDFPEEAFICAQGGSAFIGLSQPESGVTYSWDTGETSPGITVTAAGTYSLTATRSGSASDCELIRTVVVSESVAPAIGQIQVDDLQANNTITVVPAVAGDFRYALNGGAFQSDPVFHGVPPGEHQLSMQDALGCGEITETITVVGFPLFFTPNGDVYNQQWEVFGMETLTDPILSIFDRYGKLLVQLNPNTASWDGNYNGRPMPATDYWFRLEYTDSSGQRVEARFLNAHFSLRR
ncbi:T9SS type B sorting domain-containing protein [Robiginitalea myxolifaciens]|nr:T9SS type B sorting domain-containing protein [Robiginitalea myxolifaciens]